MAPTVRERRAKKLAFVGLMQVLQDRLAHEEEITPSPRKGGEKYMRHEERRVMLEQIKRDLDNYRVLVAES